MRKLVLGAFVAVLVALLTGWVWGASGRSQAERALRASELRSELLEARGSALSARVDLYSVNFGNATRNLQNAGDAVRRARQRLTDDGRGEEATRLEPALLRIEEAQRLSGQLNQDANSRAAEAVKILEEALQPVNR